MARLPFLTLLLPLASSCTHLQRLADPLVLPAGELRAEAVPASVRPVATVLRHAGPVLVRRPGAAAAHRLTFDRKLEGLAPGARVRVGTGGRAELLRRDSLVSVVLVGPALAEIGDPAGDDPLVRILGAASAELHLDEDTRVAVPGGAELRWSASEGHARAGLVALRAERQGVFALENESTGRVRIAYRDESLDLGPGGMLDLPALASGTAPVPALPEERVAGAEGAPFRVWGGVEAKGGSSWVSVRADQPGGVRGLGARLPLAAGDAVTLTLLGAEPGETGASPQD